MKALIIVLPIFGVILLQYFQSMFNECKCFDSSKLIFFVLIFGIETMSALQNIDCE